LRQQKIKPKTDSNQWKEGEATSSDETGQDNPTTSNNETATLFKLNSPPQIFSSLVNLEQQLNTSMATVSIDDEFISDNINSCIASTRHFHNFPLSKHSQQNLHQQGVADKV